MPRGKPNPKFPKGYDLKPTSPFLPLYTKSQLATHRISIQTRGRTPDLLDDYTESDYEGCNGYGSDLEGWQGLNADREHKKRRPRDPPLQPLKYLEDVKNNVLVRFLRNYGMVSEIANIVRGPRDLSGLFMHEHYSHLYFIAGLATTSDILQNCDPEGIWSLEDYCSRILVPQLGGRQIGPLRLPAFEFLCFAAACHIERQAKRFRPDLQFRHCYRAYMKSQKVDVAWLIKQAEAEVARSGSVEATPPICTVHRALGRKICGMFVRCTSNCAESAQRLEQRRAASSEDRHIDNDDDVVEDNIAPSKAYRRTSSPIRSKELTPALTCGSSQASSQTSIVVSPLLKKKRKSKHMKDERVTHPEEAYVESIEPDFEQLPEHKNTILVPLASEAQEGSKRRKKKRKTTSSSSLTAVA